MPTSQIITPFSFSSFISAGHSVLSKCGSLSALSRPQRLRNFTRKMPTSQIITPFSVSARAVAPTRAQEPHSNGATGGTATGDHPQEVSTDLLSSPQQGAGTWSTNGELKVRRPITVAGAEREPFAEVFFKLDYTRSRTHTRVQLTLDQVDFGVRNCCTRSCSPSNQQCDKNCKTVFIHNMTIQVRPKSWAQDCRRMQLQPHHEAEVFGLLQSSTLNLQMPLVCPRQASVSYQTGNTVSRAAPAFGWIPACRDAASNSVSWTWGLYRYANGRKLEFRWGWGSRPLLGLRPSRMHYPPGSFLAEASWELPPCAELQQQCLEWDVTVSLDIAVLQRQKRLPGYSVTTVPTLSFDRLLQFPELRKQDS